MNSEGMQNELLRKVLAEALSEPIESLRFSPVHGGDIHSAHRVDYADRSIFVKSNIGQNAYVLQSEYQSLEALRALGSNHYPQPLFFAQQQSIAILALPYLNLIPFDSSTAVLFGQCLASLHNIEGQSFGWEKDNFIGLTPQKNNQSDSWARFFCEQRIQPQLSLAKQNGLDANLLESVYAALPKIAVHLSQGNIQPSCVHGDLWAGNAAFDVVRQSAVLYDPAPYWGDSEVDLAMSELFGGFPSEFYHAYYDIIPKREGYEQRKNIYNLYHALNHFNLFGQAYHGLVLQHCRFLDR